MIMSCSGRLAVAAAGAGSVVALSVDPGSGDGETSAPISRFGLASTAAAAAGAAPRPRAKEKARAKTRARKHPNMKSSFVAVDSLALRDHPPTRVAAVPGRKDAPSNESGVAGAPGRVNETGPKRRWAGRQKRSTEPRRPLTKGTFAESRETESRGPPCVHASCRVIISTSAAIRRK